MHEAERIIQQVRAPLKALQELLNYLEGQGNWSAEDLGYCKSTLRRTARELLLVSRDELRAMDHLRMEAA